MKLDKITARGVNNLYRHPDTGVIYYRRYSEGHEVLRSCRTNDLELAKKAASTIAAEVFASEGPKSRQRKTALELYDLWTKRKESLNKAPATITSIKATRAHLRPFFSRMMPEDITAEWWETEYIPGVRARTHEHRKFMNDRKWVTAFLKQLIEDRVIARLPKLTNPDIKDSVGKVFTDDEVKKLLNFAQSEDLRLAILMAATMGMRRLEIFALQFDRVDLTKGVIRLRREDTKIRKPRSFAISPSVLPILVERAQRGSVWVFPSKADPSKALHKDGFKTAWANLKRFTGINGRLHDLRHTFLTKAFKSPTANPALICCYAGLSLEVAERVYLHFTEDDTKQVAGLVSYE